MAELTPMKRQYLKIKEENPDCLLFFRLGDFYELFEEDAVTASRELDLTLTTRDRGKPKEEQTPMCGVPYHAYQSYLARLIAKGYKVAICEQMEDPKTAKGLVERQVTRIVTPGTVLDPAMLEEGRSFYICGAYLDERSGGVAFCDLSTGQVAVTAASGEERLSHLVAELARFEPTEAILDPGVYQAVPVVSLLRDRLGCRTDLGEESVFELNAAHAAVTRQFQNAGDIPASEEAAFRALGGLLDYLHQTQKNDLAHLNTLQWYTGGRYMALDLSTRRNLELTESLRTGEKRGSLLWVLDKTRTPMGGRLMRQRMERPLMDADYINDRLDGVEALVGDAVAREELCACLREVSDLERIVGRVTCGTANGRDLNALAAGLAQIPRLAELLEPFDTPLLKTVRNRLDDQFRLRQVITHAIADDPPVGVHEGGVIRTGYDARVDELRDILSGGRGVMASIEARERERTGIKGIKVGYNKVFGYYLEVSRSYADKVPEDYIRKQTLTNCERYITQELKDLEHRILSAQDSIVELEYTLFDAVRTVVAEEAPVIQRTAAAVAELDVLQSLAGVAVARSYCRPQVDTSGVIEIKEGRHPVVERTLRDAYFVPNDTKMDSGENVLAIITGPNMAGKSTYMRQVALICLMAQMGSFVPAQSAHIGVVDRVFTRIGASDDLAGGRSTFMVEMSEVADILREATRHSLLILDEIGRGTSTYDGMAIARSVLEHCADPARLGARTLFATHYHELSELEDRLPGVKNYNIAAKKRGDEIIFLRKIVRGGADQSYGIEVGQLAGLPESVVRRAKELLTELEAGDIQPGRRYIATETVGQPMESSAAVQVAEELRRLDINTLTPIEAMNLIFTFKQRLKED